MTDLDHTLDLPTKQCPKCNQVLPATLEYFRRDNTKKGGVGNVCRICNRLRTREHYRENREAVLAASKTPERMEKQRVASRKYAMLHKDKLKAIKQRYYRKNPALGLERNRKWRAANPEKYRENKYKWLKANPDKARASVKKWRDKHPEFSRRWRAANPAKAKAIHYRRRALIKSLPITFTDTDWQRALEHFNYCCAYCSSQQGLWNPITADHFIPLANANCIGTVPENMIPACKSCNSKKSNKDAVQWVTKEFGARKAKQILARIYAYFDSLQDTTP